ncbi:50S ribosomal protein L31 [uncultured Clostridium sp.]|nr:50S ribosomal protein L31 [uncultured Clostridium sp.]
MMQKDIQPKYDVIEVSCACGNKFMAGSTNDEIKVEICSECHPFYTGKQKNIEKGGRIDKFKKRFKMD